MSNTVLKGLTVATVVAVGAVTLAPSSAEAGRRHHRHHGGGAAVAAAILGFAAAAAITSRPSYGYYSAPAYTYAPPPPRYYGPAYARYAPAPWTPEWYSYCHSKYRSFDPHSGTYQPYHGPRQFCR